ncbi:tyrosine-type recombinase/integrase [Massilia sp. YIM B02763]|uniref:tyrosine-type recombinase/integrase n=1 Tax=Massilia sp. YIM B02763 TaxID=3050130 RepID=UPI0025B6EB5E|nr:tyrosine-type recombinase/integrase [Massilia sp. YIM B02763]MDN4056003.1 tyrosine-type recombinase/integrase [Massilia sp. YIM B02763]
MCGPATAYIAACSQRSRSVELDTQRTYAEAIVDWLNYASDRGVVHQLVGERDVQEYRNFLSSSREGKKLAAATIGLRVGVVVRFFEWCQTYSWATSPLGKQLLQSPRTSARLGRSGWRSRTSPLIVLPRVRSRSPKPIDSLSLQLIARQLPQPYQLIFVWALTTGLRRAEICRLTVSDIFRATDIPATSGIVEMPILRKGGREKSVFVLQGLIDETRWYIDTVRPGYATDSECVFLTRRGTKISKQAVSRRFKVACEHAGIDSTFHGLRHTFALNVLDILERQAAKGVAINPLKTLQVLLGHASLETTDIYLQSLQVMSPVVEHALDFLYGKAKASFDA